MLPSGPGRASSLQRLDPSVERAPHRSGGRPWRRPCSAGCRPPPGLRSRTPRARRTIRRPLVRGVECERVILIGEQRLLLPSGAPEREPRPWEAGSPRRSIPSVSSRVVMASTTSATMRPTSPARRWPPPGTERPAGDRALPRRPPPASGALDLAADRERRVASDIHQVGVGHDADDRAVRVDTGKWCTPRRTSTATPRRPAPSSGSVLTGNVAISSTGVSGLRCDASTRDRRSRSVTMPRPLPGAGNEQTGDVFRCHPRGGSATLIPGRERRGGGGPVRRRRGDEARRVHRLRGVGGAPQAPAHGAQDERRPAEVPRMSSATSAPIR